MTGVLFLKSDFIKNQEEHSSQGHESQLESLCINNQLMSQRLDLD